MEAHRRAVATVHTRAGLRLASVPSGVSYLPPHSVTNLWIDGGQLTTSVHISGASPLMESGLMKLCAVGFGRPPGIEDELPAVVNELPIGGRRHRFIPGPTTTRRPTTTRTKCGARLSPPSTPASNSHRRLLNSERALVCLSIIRRSSIPRRSSKLLKTRVALSAYPIALRASPHRLFQAESDNLVPEQIWKFRGRCRFPLTILGNG